MFEHVISIVGGVIAGMINTLAGNGSAIVLIILTNVIGLSPNVANGTNRIGVLFQTATSAYQLNKKYQGSVLANWPIIVTTICGALLGVAIATWVSDEEFRFIYRYFMVFMLLLILINPERWLKKEAVETNVPVAIKHLIFFIVGVYGGFIQMGVGLFLLAALVLTNGLPMMASNLIKAIIVFLYTILVLAIFHFKGLVDWDKGMLIALSQALGGWLMGKYALKSKIIEKVAYYLLVFVVLIGVITQFFN